MSEKRKITRDTEVEVVNCFPGILGVKNADKNDITLSGYGDRDWITVRDIQTIKTEAVTIFEAGAMGICDPEVVKHLRMDRIYDGTILPEELEELLKPENIELLEAYLKGLDRLKLNNVCNVIRLLAKRGEVDSASVRDVVSLHSGNPNLFG